MKESSGLDPSVYGGGGSPSSTPRVEDCPLQSEGSAAFVSASTLLLEAEVAPIRGAGEKAGGGEESGSVTVTWMRSALLAEGKYREEKAGGGGELEVEEACGASGSGYGGSSCAGRIVVRNEILSDTDEASLESRVVENVMAVFALSLFNHLARGSRDLPNVEVASQVRSLSVELVLISSISFRWWPRFRKY